MKKLLFVSIIALLSVLAISCEEEEEKDENYSMQAGYDMYLGNECDVNVQCYDDAGKTVIKVRDGLDYFGSQQCVETTKAKKDIAAYFGADNQNYEFDKVKFDAALKCLADIECAEKLKESQMNTKLNDCLAKALLARVAKSE